MPSDLRRSLVRPARPLAWWRRWWPQGWSRRGGPSTTEPDPADLGICLGLELSLASRGAEPTPPSKTRVAT